MSPPCASRSNGRRKGRVGGHELPDGLSRQGKRGLHETAKVPPDDGGDSRKAVKTFRPLTPQQVAALLAKTAKAAADGRFERFKTTNGFDGTAKNPKWLGAADEGPG